MIYKNKKNIEPRWINFENLTGERGGAAKANYGAKGHAFEHLESGEEKVLCDLEASGIVRRIWITLNERQPEILHGVRLKMFWDDSVSPQVDVPLGDFFCMALGTMRGFENQFFSTAEGRSFCCFIPMPFKKHCKITITNQTEKYIHSLFYDINLTLEEVGDEDMYFCADFKDCVNELEQDVEIFKAENFSGRFLGTSIGVYPDTEKYGDMWWGEGEVKIYLDGDTQFPTLAGTGAEDYIGSAWELGEFINRTTGCVSKEENKVSMYRFHIDDPIFFEKGIKVTLQAMGGGMADKVKAAMEKGSPCAPVFYDYDGQHRIYKQEYNPEDLNGWVNFFRCDRYRVTAYYYKSVI